MLGRKRWLRIVLILRKEKGFYYQDVITKEQLESWKKEMEGAFEIALRKSIRRKEKDVQRKLSSGPCLGTLQVTRYWSEICHQECVEEN